MPSMKCHECGKVKKCKARPERDDLLQQRTLWEAMTPAPGEEQRIQKRHDDFVAQYSPGPDWEPCNQMSLDRGWLLTRLRAVEEELEVSRARIYCARCGSCSSEGCCDTDAMCPLAHAEQRLQECERERLPDDVCLCGREASQAVGDPLQDHEPTCMVYQLAQAEQRVAGLESALKKIEALQAEEREALVEIGLLVDAHPGYGQSKIIREIVQKGLGGPWNGMTD